MKDKLHNEVVTFLILRYCSMEQAFQAWLSDPWDNFSADQHQILAAYSKEILPNLILRSQQRAQKDESQG